MKVDKPLLHKIAQLAQLEIDVRNEATLIEDLSKIVTWIGKLQELDTAGVAPLNTMSWGPTMLQEDTAQPPLEHEKGLASAPSKDANYFRVPQVKE